MRDEFGPQLIIGCSYTPWGSSAGARRACQPLEARCVAHVVHANFRGEWFRRDLQKAPKALAEQGPWNLIE